MTEENNPPQTYTVKCKIHGLTTDVSLLLDRGRLRKRCRRCWLQYQQASYQKRKKVEVSQELAERLAKEKYIPPKGVRFVCLPCEKWYITNCTCLQEWHAFQKRYTEAFHGCASRSQSSNC